MGDDQQDRHELLEEIESLRARVSKLESQEALWAVVEDSWRQRHSELESLLATSRDLSSVLRLDRLLEMIASRVTQLLESDECVLFKLQPDGDMLEAILALGPLANQIRGARMQVTQGLTGIVMRTGEPLVVNDAHDDPRIVHIPPPKDILPQAHVMIAPLIAHGHKIGAMVLNRVPGRPFTEPDLRLFTGFAQHVAIAIENARLYSEIQQANSELEQRVDERTAELKRQKDEVEAVINSVGDGLLIIDQDGVIISVNPALEAMTGHNARRLIGLNSRSMRDVPAAMRQRVNAVWDEVMSGKHMRIEMPIVRADGSLLDADLNIAPFTDEDERVRGLVIVVRDMTALKEIQRMKDDFVANVTHELRTPITSLKLRYGLLRATPERLDDHLAVLARETDRLSHIIDDLLMLARIDQDRAQFNLEMLDLNTLVGQYVTDRQLVAAQRGLDLSFVAAPDLSPINADPGLLGQAIGIMLTNALNYTPAGGMVGVWTGYCSTGEAGWAGVMIADSGPGISDEDRLQLFTRFYRGEAAHQSHVAGTGLGLAIAKEIVDRHQGWIEVHSKRAESKHDHSGAVFTIWLPVAASM